MVGFFFFFVAVHIRDSWVFFAVEISWICDVDCGVTHTSDGGQVVLQWWSGCVAAVVVVRFRVLGLERQW